MRPRKYLLRDLNDPTKFKIEFRTDEPANSVALGPEFDSEEADWLEIQEVPDPEDPSYVIDVAVVNQANKTAVLKARAQAQTDETNRLDQMRTLRNALRIIRDTDATTLVQANNRLKTLATVCLALLFIVIRDDQ